MTTVDVSVERLLVKSGSFDKYTSHHPFAIPGQHYFPPPIIHQTHHIIDMGPILVYSSHYEAARVLTASKYQKRKRLHSFSEVQTVVEGGAPVKRCKISDHSRTLAIDTGDTPIDISDPIATEGKGYL